MKPGPLWLAAIAGVTAVVSSCAASLPSVRVVADARGESFWPLAARAGFVVTGSRLTAWRPQLLRERRSANEHPGAIAIAPNGQACATTALLSTGRGLRAYRLPGLEPLHEIEGACNGRVDISPSGTLVACVERDAEASFVRLFTFPSLKLVRSWGPIVDSLEALSFVGTSDDRLAVATILRDPPGTSDDARTRLELYDPRTDRAIGEFSRKGSHPYLAFSPGSDIFVWAGETGAEAWSVRSFVKVRAFGATARTMAVALSPDGALVATSQREQANIQVFDTRSGERLAAFGSEQLYTATSAHDPDQMVTDRAKLRVELLMMGTATQSGNPIAVRDLFGGSGQVADHERLAFADDQTLVSSGRGFLALWSMNHEAIQNARRAR
jgi:WD40 repeat protein